VILESAPWKDELLKIAFRLEKRKQQRRWLESSFSRLEKEVFIAAYCIRKLFEAAKTSSSIATFQFKVKAHCFIGTDITSFNRYEFEEHYDLRQPEIISKDVSFICNQLVHSYVFAPDLKRAGGLKGIFFCSDWERHKWLYRLDIDELIRYLKKVGRDYPNYSSSYLDPKKRDYVITHQEMLKRNER